MRYLLQRDETIETLLEKLSQAAFSVAEGSIPENRREDIRLGLYVALRQALSSKIVCGQDCGSLPDCAVMREASPALYEVEHERAAHRTH